MNFWYRANTVALPVLYEEVDAGFNVINHML